MKKSAKKAIEEAYYIRGKDVLRMATYVLKSIEDAEDTVQTAFAELYAKERKYKGIDVEGAIKLFYKYTVNVCQRKLREKNGQSLAYIEDIGEIVSFSAPLDELANINSIFSEMIRYLESALSQTDIMIFEMKYKGGAKHKEIAEAIGGGLDERAVGRRVEHIKLKIKKHIYDMGGKYEW